MQHLLSERRSRVVPVGRRRGRIHGIGELRRSTKHAVDLWRHHSAEGCLQEVGRQALKAWDKVDGSSVSARDAERAAPRLSIDKGIGQSSLTCDVSRDAASGQDLCQLVGEVVAVEMKQMICFSRVPFPHAVDQLPECIGVHRRLP